MAGEQPIDGLRPVAPEPSLLTVADTLPAPRRGDTEAAPDLPGSREPSPFWRSGVAWRSSSCAPAFREARCMPGGATRDEKEVAPNIEQHAFRPYTVYVPWSCDWVVPGSEGDYGYVEDARAQLEAATAWQVSNELWTAEGDAGDTDGGLNPSLESVASPLGTGGVAANPVWAMGRLLQAYFDCAQAGGAILHIPPVVIPDLQRQGAISQTGAALRGPMGTRVSPGPGYPVEGAVGPQGEVAGEGEAFMYVSGPVQYATTPIRILPESDRQRHQDPRMNRYELLAERFAIHRFDPCCVFGILVDVPNAPTIAS